MPVACKQKVIGQDVGAAYALLRQNVGKMVHEMFAFLSLSSTQLYSQIAHFNIHELRLVSNGPKYTLQIF